MILRVLEYHKVRDAGEGLPSGGKKFSYTSYALPSYNPLQM